MVYIWIEIIQNEFLLSVFSIFKNKTKLMYIVLLWLYGHPEVWCEENLSIFYRKF